MPGRTGIAFGAVAPINLPTGDPGRAAGDFEQVATDDDRTPSAAGGVEQDIGIDDGGFLLDQAQDDVGTHGQGGRRAAHVDVVELVVAARAQVAVLAGDEVRDAALGRARLHHPVFTGQAGDAAVRGPAIVEVPIGAGPLVDASGSGGVFTVDVEGIPDLAVGILGEGGAVEVEDAAAIGPAPDAFSGTVVDDGNVASARTGE